MLSKETLGCLWDCVFHSVVTEPLISSNECFSLGASQFYKLLFGSSKFVAPSLQCGSQQHCNNDPYPVHASQRLL